ncbi:hypothetical protein Rs2_14588 [Raphanus sativus]|uniref:Probable L-cysteine desulfhydrase, chloroplastic n=1 Tax=Raphanus sativus TaxID=3726 RepID=A0A6J0NFV1_RAPSA|nr:probable L-cysteine desulfhydrase, chloroplastic [Raphanus sativus]KAJ4900637.1 hypothetical protein Rs2_14588 [Raphanus sativus]
MASLSPPEEAASYHRRRSKRYPSSSTTTNGVSAAESVPDKRHKIFHESSSSLISPSEIEAEFSHHDPAFARINNGSFGCCPSSVISVQRDWQLRFLRQPDRFFFDDLKPSISQSRAAIRRLINAEHDDEVSLVDNATTAAAIVLQQTAWAFREGRFDRGDAVVMLHYAFGSVKKSVEAYVSRSGGEVIEVQLPFPVNSAEEIINRFRAGLELGKANGTRRVRLALIDHVTSMPSVVIPIKELVKICREEGVDQVFVDAAHGIGCVDVDMKEIGADFYASNLHKWFFAPPSVAFLYCKRSGGGGGSNLHHPVVSHEYGNGLAVESTWVGTRDYSAQLVVPSILEFVNRFEGGIDGIKKRNHESVVEMGQMLVKSWGTQLGCPPEMCASMVMVGLPVCLGVSSESDAVKLRNLLRERFCIEIPTYYRAPGEGETDDSITGYVRISFQVYNKPEEYHRLKDAVNELVRDGFKCTSLSD